jgi:FlaA1/EpsC-like NDP-sugar epimerase
MKIKRRGKGFTDSINKGRIGFFLADAVVLSLALYLAFLLRFDGGIPPRYFSMFLWALPVVLGIKIPLLILFRTYRFSWGYVGLNELYMTSLACGGGSLAFATVLFLLRHWPVAVGMPRSILGIDFVLTLLGIGGIRLSKRVLQHVLKRTRERKGKRALIVGAGGAGSQLVRAILEEQKSGFYPIGFIDDDPRKRGLSIHGVSVLGARNRLPGLIRSGQAEAVIIAMPSVSSRVIRETVDLARKGGVKEIKILPFLSELYSGEVKVSAVREVQPEDLLHREPVLIDTQVIGRFLNGKTVLVTGAAGSIGSELCRQILRFGSERLIAFDIDETGLETGLFNLEKDLERRFPKGNVKIIVGDVREQKKVARTFQQYQPRVVFHAAAYKHVPLMESFPEEAVKTNVFGTRTVVQEACRSGVEAFVMISTDKAVNPTSVMGATKRVAEMEVDSGTCLEAAEALFPHSWSRSNVEGRLR